VKIALGFAFGRLDRAHKLAHPEVRRRTGLGPRKETKA
jgi:hypothetical protein